MIALGFLNPMLLWALPLVAIPIIIHILNRRRFKTVRWAAMEFLLRAMKRNRRRVRMEHLLLLLLRTLAVLFLVLLVTRPQLTGGGLIGVRTHHVILLDDSASMRQRIGTADVYEDARDQIRGMATRFVDTRSGDLFTLIRATDASEPDVFQQRVGPGMPRVIGDALSSHTASDQIMDLAELLAQGRKRAAETEEAGRTEYYLFSDFRQRDWLAENDKARAEVVAQLRAMNTETEHLTVQPLGVGNAANLAVVDVRRKDRIAVQGVLATMSVDVMNQGRDKSNPTELAITIDGTTNVTRPVPELSPGQRVSIDIEHTFHSPGYHGIVASLPTDRFPVDDTRALSLEVLDKARVLIVDGDPGDDPEGAESYYLAAALDPGGDAVTGVEVRTVISDNFGDLVFDEFDTIIMANVPVPEPPVVERLEKFVHDGGGLLIFPGNQIEPERYNNQLFRDGKGVLPARLQDIAGDTDRPEKVYLADKDHPVVALAPEFFEAFFANFVLVGRFMALEMDDRVPAKVVLRKSDVEGDPLLAIHAAGAGGGYVALFGMTADKAWTNWAEIPCYLPFVVELHKFAVKEHDLSAVNHGASGSMSLDVDLGLYRPDVSVEPTDGDGERRTFTVAVPGEGEAGENGADGAPGLGDGNGEEGGREVAKVDVPMRDLSGLGLFRAVLESHGQGTEDVLFSRNPPVEEGVLHRMTKTGFWERYPTELEERITFLDEGAGGLSGRSGEGELWRILAAALLAGLLLESILAWRFGRR